MSWCCVVRHVSFYSYSGRGVSSEYTSRDTDYQEVMERRRNAEQTHQSRWYVTAGWRSVIHNSNGRTNENMHTRLVLTIYYLILLVRHTLYTTNCVNLIPDAASGRQEATPTRTVRLMDLGDDRGIRTARRKETWAVLFAIVLGKS